MRGWENKTGSEKSVFVDKESKAEESWDRCDEVATPPFIPGPCRLAASEAWCVHLRTLSASLSPALGRDPLIRAVGRLALFEACSSSRAASHSRGDSGIPQRITRQTHTTWTRRTHSLLFSLASLFFVASVCKRFKTISTWDDLMWLTPGEGQTIYQTSLYLNDEVIRICLLFFFIYMPCFMWGSEFRNPIKLVNERPGHSDWHFVYGCSTEK